MGTSGGMPTLTRISRTAVNVTIIPEEPPVAGCPRRVLKWPQHPHAWGTLGDVPGEMDQQPGHYPGQHRPMPTPYDRCTGHHDHGGKGMRDRALVVVSEQPEVQRDVI